MNRAVRTDAPAGIARVVSRPSTVAELMRFGMVGVVVNLALYLGYLLLVRLGVEYRSAMTVVYVAGTVLGFVLHRTWTFRSQGAWAGAFGRYAVAYVVGYLLNLSGLWFLVEAASLPHAPAQAIMIVAVAAFLFVLQKLWIFPKVS